MQTIIYVCTFSNVEKKGIDFICKEKKTQFSWGHRRRWSVKLRQAASKSEQWWKKDAGKCKIYLSDVVFHLDLWISEYKEQGEKSALRSLKPREKNKSIQVLSAQNSSYVWGSNDYVQTSGLSDEMQREEEKICSSVRNIYKYI